MEPLSGDRKCFRMINGVLAERTVKDVVPALKTNLEGLEKVLTELTEQYNTKTTEMEKWKVSLVFVRLTSLRFSVCLTRTIEEEQCPGGAVGLSGRIPRVHATSRARRRDRLSGASKACIICSRFNTCLSRIRNYIMMTVTYVFDGQRGPIEADIGRE